VPLILVYCLNLFNVKKLSNHNVTNHDMLVCDLDVCMYWAVLYKQT